jgi:rare lipoprotein A
MIRSLLILVTALFLISCSGPQTVSAKDALPDSGQVNVSKSYFPWRVKSEQKGEASWYSVKSNGGTQTASGKPLREGEATAAHKTLKMGTKVRVTNLRNGKSQIVKITDRGPFTKGRIIDVTTSVAKKIGFYSRGIAPVKVEVLEKIATESSES